jgi:hypothetical protein
MEPDSSQGLGASNPSPADHFEIFKRIVNG